jgi:hypothetical protein
LYLRYTKGDKAGGRKKNMKHQSQCYRTIKGQRLLNYCDLIMSDEENNKVIAEAKKKYKIVRKLKHPSGYYQLFISETIK